MRKLNSANLILLQFIGFGLAITILPVHGGIVSNPPGSGPAGHLTFYQQCAACTSRPGFSFQSNIKKVDNRCVYRHSQFGDDEVLVSKKEDCVIFKESCPQPAPHSTSLASIPPKINATLSMTAPLPIVCRCVCPQPPTASPGKCASSEVASPLTPYQKCVACARNANKIFKVNVKKDGEFACVELSYSTNDETEWAVTTGSNAIFSNPQLIKVLRI